MRSVFLLLLLSNVLYFSWHFFNLEMDETSRPIPAMPGERLVMLAELEDSERPLMLRPDTVGPPVPVEPVATIPTAAEEPDDTLSRVCVAIHGIEQQSDLEMLLARLERHGAERIAHGEESGVRVNYWVILPPLERREDVEAAAEILAARRVRDYFIVRSGEHENAISLGVFSTPERAEQRKSQIEALRARLPQPRIELREVAAVNYWVTYRIDASAQQALQQTIPGIGMVRSESCR
jgi:hypothetical protein